MKNVRGNMENGVFIMGNGRCEMANGHSTIPSIRFLPLLSSITFAFATPFAIFHQSLFH